MADRARVVVRVERLVANAVWRWLIRRGWIVRLNTEDRCSYPVKRDGRVYDYGWRPMFSVRYGHQPVYRGPGEVRWVEETADGQ